MQIDFHHGVTYVVARFAGFDHRQAATVAHASQYVDDATNGGIIRFDNKALYSRISSAHKMLDYRNFEELANHRVWIPFHFLPGNDGKQAGENGAAGFVEKIICRPNSPVAQEMVRICIEQQGAHYGLHRLGITMHVFADTWAHQGFVGVIDRVNEVNALDEQENPEPGLLERLKDYFGDLYDEAVSRFVGDMLPLGHGAVLTYPDRPYLTWCYRISDGSRVERDNPSDFTEAADEMCKVMQRYRLGDSQAEVPGLTAEQRGLIAEKLRSIEYEEGEDRHRQWISAIAEGEFGFEPVVLEYRAKGEGSWKHQALGTVKHRDEDEESDTFPYSSAFLTSDWKLFHDALQAHRFTVLHDVLPGYGICAA